MSSTSKLSVNKRPEEGASKFERRREEIVQAAVAALNEHGVRGMTFGHVAADLGVVPTTIGYYFRHKEDLAVACFLETIRKMNQIADRALQQDGARARLRAIIHEYFDFRRRIAEGEEDEAANFHDFRTTQDPTANQAYVDFFKKVRTIFSSSDAEPLGRADRNARTHIVLSQIYWAVHWLPQYNPEDYPGMADRVSNLLEYGFASEASVWNPPTIEGGTSWADDADGVPNDAFLRVATQLINEEGYLGASVQRISARLGVTKGSFYHHNETKDDLVVRCFERTWQIMRGIQGRVNAQAQNGFDNLVAFASHLVGGQVSGQQILLRTSALSAVPQDMRPKLLAGFDRSSSRISSVVSDGIADGSVRPIDALAAAQVIAGSINSASELAYWVPGLTPQSALDLYLKPLFLGLFSPAAG
ncbi:TetR/AcrR family transcriptional regulator [Phenylobacterium sp.]|uniref:TetR/AcrR family transcriptional regulator n=1 Tax=Phenylobacterium sp. TaxID=1871053 RepID=UPI0025D5625D|nr:TetR/AcrR family transcriptional regulator [Phenylobacterium sp.]